MIPRQPVTAVVTPCYNAASYLQEMLDSVHDQTFSDWIHVVVDDGSTDTSADMLRTAAQNDGRIVRLRQDNAGVAIARNTGMEWLLRNAPSVGSVLFLDADDRLLPTALEVLLR